MKRGDKIREGLKARVAVWDQLPAVGSKGPRTKLVRQDKGTAAYHKPGSQSGRKGYGKRKRVSKK